MQVETSCQVCKRVTQQWIRFTAYIFGENLLCFTFRLRLLDGIFLRIRNQPNQSANQLYNLFASLSAIGDMIQEKLITFFKYKENSLPFGKVLVDFLLHLLLSKATNVYHTTLSFRALALCQSKEWIMG